MSHAANRRWAWLFIILLLIPGGVAGAQKLDPEVVNLTASVTMTRSAAVVEGCGFTTVDVWVNDVVGLYGADFRMTFDPARLQVVDQDSYTYGTQLQPIGTFLKTDFVIRKVACNALDSSNSLCDEPAEVGTIWYSNTQVNPSVEVSGSGPIASITFRALSPGSSPLVFYYTKLADRNGYQIPNTTTGSDLTAVPIAQPAVDIGRLFGSDTTARLSWGKVTGAATYRVYRAIMPYFLPAEPAWGVTTGLSYEDPEALGSTVEEYYYVVKSACPDGFISAHSNRVGAFDFDLVPGS